MKLAAIFDVSAFIWDNAHFNLNKNKYYPLMAAIPNILEKLKEQKIPIVFRYELLLEIQAKFPFADIPREYSTFRDLTYHYLSNINMVDYPNSVDSNITCDPSLLKDFFENSTNYEIVQLINHIYNENSTIHKLLTFSILWQGPSKLCISNGLKKEIDTLFCDNQSDHDTIILSLKKIFEHNSKHDKYKSSNYSYYGKKISPLGCYDDRIKDATEAQGLLDSSVFYKADFFNFDENRNTCVIFVNTLNNIFHGFDISLPEAEIEIIKEMLG